MNYQEFKNEVMANIKDYLSEEYRDYDMKVQTIKKSSCEYEGLMIGPKDRHMSSTKKACLSTKSWISLRISA